MNVIVWLLALAAANGVGAFAPAVRRDHQNGSRIRGAYCNQQPRRLPSANVDSGAHATDDMQLEQKTWTFRGKYPIAYEVATSSVSGEASVDLEVVPILLLNGFGVGSFHQHRLMCRLLKEQQSTTSEKPRQYVIYGIDYLGQGKSWPSDCDDGNSEDEKDLGYSADTWLEQLQGFVETVVVPSSSDKKVHLVGNSVGGYLSTILASRHPHLIASLTLLNATPVWGLNLPGWDGKLPAPPLPKLVGKAAFDTIRRPDIIDQYLEAAYFRREAYDGTYGDSFDGCPGSAGETLGAKIRGCTEGKGGHAAFASILWSAPASEVTKTTTEGTSSPAAADYYAALGSLPIDVLLLFGADDPWCTPAVAKRMHATLADRDGSDGPAQRYVSLENVGHCPNHEAPGPVARVLLHWIEASSGKGRKEASLVSTDEAQMHEPWGNIGVREVSIEESRDLGVIDRLVSSMVG
ncbi:hypothetical protein ACHAXT_002696 [Thalassiosira profunda]